MQDRVAKFGHAIRLRRERQGLSLPELGRRSGLTPNYIGTVEHGKRDPSLTTVVALTQGLGVPPGEPFGDVKPLGPHGMQFALMFHNAAPKVQVIMLKVMHVLAAAQWKQK